MLGEYVRKNGRLILDTSLATIKQKREYKVWLTKRDSIKKDTASVYLAFNPEIKTSDEELNIAFEEHFRGKKAITSISTNYTLDLTTIKLNQHFKLKHDSLFHKDYRIWREKYDFVFSGIFEVSRIIFDESKTYGILTTGYTCGSLCGQGHLVFIKKVKGKWIIDKIRMTWIS